jgi:hypothetical protein
MKMDPQIAQITQIFSRSGPGTLRVAPSPLIRLIRGLFSDQTGISIHERAHFAPLPLHADQLHGAR